MAIREEGHHKELVCYCDECGEGYYGGMREWSSFIEELRRAGWIIRKENENGWRHACPECAN